MTIGQLARAASVNVQTVRYYERRGLLPDPPRTGSGYRQYAGDSVDRILFIKRAQRLGFSLDEISDLLALRVHPRTNCSEVRTKAEAKQREIQGKIDALREMHASLDRLVHACEARDTTSECPIIETLES